MTDSSFDLLKVFLDTGELPALGPGPRNAREPLATLETRLDIAFQQSRLPDSNRKLVRALILLWHDYLDESHSISQEIHSRDGSLVHGIMHRREPDYWNSKYWFNRVGPHPAFRVIGAKVAELLDGSDAATLRQALVPHGTLDPCAFVDQCEHVARAPNVRDGALLQRVQQIEFTCLLEGFCQ